MRSYAHYSYTTKAGTVSLIAGLLLLATYLMLPQPTRLLVALAYCVLGFIGVVIGPGRHSAQLDTIMQVLLGGVTSFGLMFFTINAAWWMALVIIALLLVALAATETPRRALMIGAGHVLAVVIVYILRWGVLYPELSTEHILLGGGALLLGPLAWVRFLRPVQPAEALAPAQPTAAQMPSANPIATQLHITADGMARATEAINEVMHQLSDGANEQATATGMTNQRLDTFLQLSDEIREQARAVTITAEQMASISAEGQSAIVQAMADMGDIRVQVTNIAETIVHLGELTRRIDEIIMSVSEIATQSNLLALNASIEAARAGTQGRGFAVVADEVRSLSQQSTAAAQQVRGILGEIQQAIRQTVEATQVGMAGVDTGEARTQEANTIMQGLSISVNESLHAVRTIYEAIRQQAEDLEEISITMQRIERITQQNLASTRMMETVSTNLTHLSGDLQQVVASQSIDYDA